MTSYLNDIDIVVEPWEYSPIGKDDHWGVHLKHKENWKADIYFLNEGFLKHKLLYTEVGPSSNHFEESDLAHNLSLRGLEDRKNLAKWVELDIKKNILEKYNADLHLKTLELYSRIGTLRFATQPLVTEVFSNGSPEKILLDIENDQIVVSYNPGGLKSQIKDLKTFFHVLNYYDNVFFTKVNYSIAFQFGDNNYTDTFNCSYEDSFKYLHRLFQFTW